MTPAFFYFIDAIVCVTRNSQFLRKTHGRSVGHHTWSNEDAKAS